MPPSRSPRYVPVDELMPRITVDQVAAFYGAALPELQRTGDEIRAACFLACGKAQETGPRALAIQDAEPARPWMCHQYGCGKHGNLVGLCDLLKPGDSHGGRPRGERFKAIAADLRAMVEGTLSSPEACARPAVPPAAAMKQATNIPLARSENPKARALVDLDRKFVRSLEELPPAASAYLRRRPWLTEDLQRKWRVGYLPRDAGEDRAGGTMRGSIVYPLQSERGEVLTWFGRDPAFEEKHRQWEAAGRSGREPEKCHFVKGFRRGLELFGQQSARLNEPGYRAWIEEHGVLVVEGPNDVIRLDALGIPAVGLLSNVATDEQIGKIAGWAQRIGRGRAILLLDCDPEGENGAREILYSLAQRCDVRLAWSDESHQQRFRGCQPEALSADQVASLAASWTLVA